MNRNDTTPGRPAVGFLLEQTLGHVSHSRNLQRSLAHSELADIRWRELPFEPTRRRDAWPPWSNWTVRAGLAARRAVRELQRQRRLDVLLVHTQVPATLLGGLMRRTPTVISLDATPLQIDTLGNSYNHEVQPGPIESLKWRMHRSMFHRAAALITWSEWAADSLVADYGVDRTRIEVIPPGVVPAQWRRERPRQAETGVVKVLFVGGDFERKGGQLLLDAAAHVRVDPDVRAKGLRVELHLVTGATLEPDTDVHIYNSMRPNSPELIELYHSCDIFALPTQGDCSPLVLAEAAAAGLPSVATDVGAIRETVVDDVTGHLVTPTIDSIESALRRLVLEEDHRHRLGAAAADHAARTMDAEANANRLLDRVVQTVAPGQRQERLWLTVSGEVDPDVRRKTKAGDRPQADYVAISDTTGAELLDRKQVHDKGSRTTAALLRIAGNDVAMAHHIFANRRDLDLVITDGENVGIPLAALLRLAGARRPRHLMIGHRLSPRKKTFLVRLLGLSRSVDEVLVYSTSQMRVAESLFDRPGQRVSLIDFMVDTDFFHPELSPHVPSASRPRLCSAGREFRDYPTLIEAVRDLDVDVVIASASPWSKREDNARIPELPANVTVTALSQKELRDEIARSDLVVVPLQPTDFQAGVTTILEAMAMARPVVCTRTIGQIDVVVDGANGIYVPSGDVASMRRAIESLLADPDHAAELGRHGRELAETRFDVRAYADRIAAAVDWHLGGSDSIKRCGSR